MELGFAHVCLRVRDLAATEAFYTGALGLERVFAFRKDDELFGYYLGLGKRNFIEVFRADGPGDRGTTVAHLCFETDDIDALRADLVAKGIEVTEKQLGCDGSWQVWLEDPDGIPIEIHQYTADSAQLAPRDVVVDW